MNYFIEVMDGSNLTYYFRSYLFSKGFRFRKKQKIWLYQTHDLDFIGQIKSYCKSNGLVCIVYTRNQIRNRTYRENFFEKNQPLIKDYYLCAYCLKPVHKKKITVDHVISVKKAKTNKLYQKIMKKMKISNVNDEKNLVACCSRCNQRKGKKGGLWVVRGFLGKHKIWLLSCYILMIFLIFLMIVVLFPKSH